RRSLYFAHHGEEKMQFLELFDAANPCDCYQRSDSVRPQQALALANSELAQNMGRLLARKLWEQVQPAHETDAAREAAFLTAAFEQVLARPPSARETEVAAEFLRRQMKLFRDEAPTLADPAGRAREGLVQALFSHNDFVTMR